MLLAPNHFDLSVEFVDKYLPRLSGAAIKLFLIISRNQNTYDHQPIKMSQDYISSKYKISVNTIKESANLLKDIGLIIVNLVDGRYYYGVNYSEEIVKVKQKKKEKKEKPVKAEKIVVPMVQLDAVYKEYDKQYERLYCEKPVVNFAVVGKKIREFILQDGYEKVMLKMRAYMTGDYWFTANGRRTIHGFMIHYQALSIEDNMVTYYDNSGNPVVVDYQTWVWLGKPNLEQGGSNAGIGQRGICIGATETTGALPTQEGSKFVEFTDTDDVGRFESVLLEDDSEGI